MHFVSPGSRRDSVKSSCASSNSTKKKYAGIYLPSFFSSALFVLSKIPSLLQLSHNAHTHPIHSPPNHALPLLHFSTSFLPERGGDICVSVSALGSVKGELKLHKVPLTQWRVFCEAGATDGSTPQLTWSHVSHTHTRTHAHIDRYAEAQWHFSSHLYCTQEDTCAFTANPHVHTVPMDRHTRRLSSFQAAVRCAWGCVFFPHGMCWYSFSKPLVCSITLQIYFPSHTAVSDLTLWLLYCSELIW